jgi:homoserine kinase type II
MRVFCRTPPSASTAESSTRQPGKVVQLNIDSVLTTPGSTWILPDLLSTRPLVEGTNNSVHLLETASGTYVVRLYRNHIDSARMTFETSVLTALQNMGLPFAVPAPIPTRTGELYAWVSSGAEKMPATLTPFLSGTPAQPGHLRQAAAAGEALGVLDVALAQVPVPAAGISWRSYGDLEHCHQLVPDPRAGILQLPVTGEATRRLLERYDELIEQVPALYANLPQQLSHEDYAPSNILMEGERVTGVLDFEFCARDLGIMDMTVALSWWPVGELGTGKEWPVIEAFCSGYACQKHLTWEEIAAIPTVYDLRAYTSLIHRLGRYRQGVSSLEAVVERAYSALERHRWQAENSQRLVDTVARCLIL